MGFLNILSKFFGKKSDNDVKAIMPLVSKIHAEFALLQNLSHDELRSKSQELKNEIRSFIANEKQQITELKEKLETEEITVGEREDIYAEIDRLEKEIDKQIAEKLNDALPLAFAIVKDTARRFTQNKEICVTAQDWDKELASRKNHIRIDSEKAIWQNSWTAGGGTVTWEMIHYDVQLIGGIVLHQGKISEMATGEGKTLVATLPMFLNALAGLGVHLVTVNDYLARRDSEWMGPIFEFHGLSVDCIDNHEPHSEERRKAYHADITYGTNNEFGFDYLRDNMVPNPDDLVQRKHFYAIVDEVDSVLIDDARTPLIISGPTPKGENQLFDLLKPKVIALMNEQKKLFLQLLSDSRKLIAAPDKASQEKGALLLLRAYKALPKNKALIKYLSEAGVKVLLHNTENIYLADNAKRMPEVTEELFFVIDEKNNSVELTDKGIDLITASTEDAKFFILPDIGSEIVDLEKSGLSDAEKLAKKDTLLADYAIKSERVHTISQLLKAYAMFERDVEYVIIDNKVKIVDEQTGRILEGRRYSDGLHQAIEAKENVKIEAATQTYATVTLQNYFRMYVKLAGMTGTAETEAGEFWSIYKLDVVVIPTNKSCIRKDMQDMVYKTKREKYKAVIDEIVRLTEAGRPVLVGTTSVEISELIHEMLKRRNIPHNVLNAKLHQREADIVAEAGKSKTVTIATNMAGRGTDIKLSPEVRAAGGLAIIGTERHESRRVDRQLRGRAGRQGDPGSSQFFVSLEDDLMRLFGSDRIARIMDRLGHKEGDMIQHSMISKSIERAQKKVEENNFGIRKRLLEYDDVMNAQREVIYKRRRHALFGERLDTDLDDLIYDVCFSLVDEYHGKIDFSDFKLESIRHISIEPPFTEKEFLEQNPDKLSDKLYTAVIESFKRKSQEILRQAQPVIEDIYQSKQYESIIVPITDGTRILHIPVNLQKAFDTESKEVVRSFHKALVLNTIDDDWKEHLRSMDDLKTSVQNAAYEQKDPLLIYKLEAFNEFKRLVDKINKTIASTLLKSHIHGASSREVKRAEEPKHLDMSKLKTSKAELVSSLRRNEEQNAAMQDTREQKVQTYVRTEKKVGRNDPCPCGSGKKYKQCHGKGLDA